MMSKVTYFSEFSEPDTYIKSNEAINNREFYLGIDEDKKPTMLYYYVGKFIKTNSSQLISIRNIKKGHDSIIKLTLEDAEYVEQFEKICRDIIDYTNSKNNQIENHLIERWESWRKLLISPKKDLLNANAIKGLIGEMLTIIECHDKKIEIDKIIDAWTGPNNYHQDFVFEDFWIEVKTSSESSNTISISSVEQLDDIKKGYLKLFEVVDTNNLDSLRINLNDLNDKICSLIKNDLTFNKYTDKLLSEGYSFDKRYYEINYRIKEENAYFVDSNFECIRRKNLPDSIGNVKYELDKKIIEKWKV